MKKFVFIISFILLQLHSFAQNKKSDNKSPSLIILGNVQDAGAPHIGCKKDCCKNLFAHPQANLKVVSIGVIDHQNNKKILFDATPDVTVQTKILSDYAAQGYNQLPDGIFLTHAHIGHYTGLMYFGREGIWAKEMPVYAMPKLKNFLENNGPWSQLVSLKNISLRELANETPVQITSNISVTPVIVPHRDEYSETVGFIIAGPHKKALFIPDIDKWSKWNKNIVDEIAKVDYAFIDATFFDEKEINNKKISEIPHPFVIESMALFKNLPAAEKKKVHFIHLNHTNPLLNINSPQTKQVIKSGYNIARMHDIFKL